jgi:hypothetical protein
VSLLTTNAANTDDAYAAYDASTLSATYVTDAALSSSKIDDIDYSVAASAIVNDMKNNQVSFTSSTPECWRVSINAINRLAMEADDQNVVFSGSSFCASMTVDQHNILTLELTNCQMMMTNEPFFDSTLVRTNDQQHTDAVKGCAVGMGGTIPYDPSACFHVMSRDAKSVFNMFSLHTKQVCFTLTEERRMIQKDEATTRLIHASSTAYRYATMMQNHTEMIMREQREENQRMKDELLQTATMMQNHTEMIIQEQREENRRMNEARKQNEEESAKKQREELAQTASMMQEQTKSMMREQREELVQTASILHAQTETIIAQTVAETAALISEQADIITKQKRDLERMHEVIQPLSSIESYVKMAIGGFTAVKAFANYFLSANVTWMVTTVPLLRSSRRYTYAIFTLGLFAELISIWFSEHTPSLDSEELVAIDTVRFLTRVVAFITMMLSSFVACVFPPKKDASPITMDDILKSQMEFVSKLNASAPTEINYERSQNPHRSPAKYSTLGVNSGRTTQIASHDEQASFIVSNRNFKPRHRSRSPHRSHAGLTMPVVSPIKSHVFDDDAIKMIVPDRNRGTTSHVSHRHANKEKSKHSKQIKLDYMSTLIQNGGEEVMCGESSSSDDISVDGSTTSVVSKNDKKRSASDLYSSSSTSDEDDDCMSVSSTPDLESDSREQKKTKLTNVANVY